MDLPWVTTKGADPSASGRFGIGQKTLNSLGGPIQVHSHPFHFRLSENGPVWCRPASSIANLYHARHHETLLAIPLHQEVDVGALVQFADELGSRSLVFLRSVR